MNNSKILVEEEISKEANVTLREQITQTTEILEALQNIAGSSYWQVLKQHIFDNDLRKVQNRLAVESDEKEIFRLQGEIRVWNKTNLEKLLVNKRNELQALRKKLNE